MVTERRLILSGVTTDRGKLDRIDAEPRTLATTNEIPKALYASTPGSSTAFLTPCCAAIMTPRTLRRKRSCAFCVTARNSGRWKIRKHGWRESRGESLWIGVSGMDGHGEIALDDAETSVDVASSETSADDTVHGAQVGRELEKLIAALPSKLREPLVLSTIEEMSPREVAETLRINEAAVRSRIFRARQILKEKLAATGRSR